MTDLCLSFLRIADVMHDYWSPADETETKSSRVRSDSQIRGRDNWFTNGGYIPKESNRVQSNPVRLQSQVGCTTIESSSLMVSRIK